MSLHFLGIAHFPVLHSQLGSPTSTFSSFMRDDQSSNSKDVLLQKINDPSANILNLTLNQQAVAAFCRKVDEMEKLVALDAVEEDIDYDSERDAEYARLS